MAFSDHIQALDRAVVAQLGQEIAYAPSVGDAVSAQGVFDSAYVMVDAGGEAGVSSCSPAVFFMLEDLPDSPDPIDDRPTITVSGVDYEVAEARPDGKGGVLFILHVAE